MDAQHHKETLLFVDDEENILDIASEYFEFKGFQVLTASNGEEALEILRDPAGSRPAIILLDLNMPRMNGLEFLRIARREGSVRGVPVVVLTTSRQDQDVVQGFELAVAGYMVKPVDYRKFVEVMKAIDLYWTLSELPPDEAADG